MKMKAASAKDSLSGKARRHLRALGHHLRPVILVGKDGVTAGLVAATATALDDHELIKVKLGERSDGAPDDLAESLAVATQSALVGRVGRTALFYRRHPDRPRIVLPKTQRKQ